ncbi:MAG TPA: CHAP domain-containing protein [Flavobacteriales bacterium]|nr:CHAP domain-containing protein [Flavobacteriales bacterium]
MVKRTLIILIAAVVMGLAAWWLWTARPAKLLRHITHTPGAAIDSLHGVTVHHNGGMGAVHGRHVVDGYNVGLRYQCVEFVKRYYLEHYGHRMPNSYGHAKDFFDTTLTDGALNPDRGLHQFTNPSASPPVVGDLLVLGPWRGNPYGHVAIVSRVEHGEVEVVQQNTADSRATYDLDLVDGRWRIDERRILGWLGKR